MKIKRNTFFNNLMEIVNEKELYQAQIAKQLDGTCCLNLLMDDNESYDIKSVINNIVIKSFNDDKNKETLDDDLLEYITVKLLRISKSILHFNNDIAEIQIHFIDVDLEISDEEIEECRRVYNEEKSQN